MNESQEVQDVQEPQVSVEPTTSVSGPDDPENMYNFTAPVGEPEPRVFQFDVQTQALYTDIIAENAMGGYQEPKRLKITAASTDEYSVRLWNMTKTYMDGITAQYAADISGDGKPIAQTKQIGNPTEGPSIPLTESIPIEQIPQNVPVEKVIENIKENEGYPMPPEFTGEEPMDDYDDLDLPTRVYSQFQVQAEVLINVQQNSIEYLGTLCELYIEDQNANKFAKTILENSRRTAKTYGLNTRTESDPGQG
jgi:hypothetical protein